MSSYDLCDLIFDGWGLKIFIYLSVYVAVCVCVCAQQIHCPIYLEVRGQLMGIVSFYSVCPVYQTQVVKLYCKRF